MSLNNHHPITCDFEAVLTGGTCDLLIGSDSVKMTVHRNLLIKLPYFADILADGATTEIVLPDVSTFSASVTVQYLYGFTDCPFDDMPRTLPSKIAIAQTFMVADRLGMARLADSVLESCQRFCSLPKSSWRFGNLSIRTLLRTVGFVFQLTIVVGENSSSRDCRIWAWRMRSMNVLILLRTYSCCPLQNR